MGLVLQLDSVFLLGVQFTPFFVGPLYWWCDDCEHNIYRIKELKGMYIYLSVCTMWFKPPLLMELWGIVGYCSRYTMLLITWYDAVAHHILWGSMDINPQ